ncbi:hypothetical protein [Polynucleobacter sp. IMCC 29146]|uniref:hypothetical protein n=1 Tax=Polynucleobacter sp. IMCC 29146 TaxID=2780953 RepID=UPI001F354D07|nr:hypothetical protein [Polynucleobacter sp. IMCC 29146]MCE7530736.1 hypothetical protein [Polynucleobacter sp. IMCC 29146]
MRHISIANLMGRNQFFFIAIISLTLIQFTYAYWIPFQFIPGPHDDLLYFRLAESIANLKWLGVFDQTTLIKGFAYPFFLSLSIFFKIPLRILESILICSSALYFIIAIYRAFPNKIILTLIYGAIIFYPFQYSLISFRLLRDMIYLPLLLLIISSLYLMYLDRVDHLRKGKWLWIHPVIFGGALFFFWNTREEGIWIAPALGLWMCLLLWRAFQIDDVRGLAKQLAIAVLIMCTLQGILLSLNAYKYRAIVVTIFKESNFQRGFSALYRVDSPKLWNEDISQDDWKTLFQISPTAAELRPFVTGKTYRFWADITCNAISELGYGAIEQTACPAGLPPGNVPFALMDGLFEIGYRNPAQISEFMGRMANEIDTACKAKKMACIAPPPFMLSRNIFEYGIPWDIFLHNLKRSIYVMATPTPTSLNLFNSYYDLNSVPNMRAQLGGKLFDSQLGRDLNATEAKAHQEMSQFFVSKSRILNVLFNWSSKAYSIFVHWAWVLFLPMTWLAYRRPNSFNYIVTTLLLLAISRASVISALDYYAVAPIWPLALVSGTYLLFLAELLSCGYLCQLLIARFQSSDRNSLVL